MRPVRGLAVRLLRPALVAALVLGGPEAGAAADLASAPAGSVVPAVATLSDPAATWDLYLPRGYDRSRRWPVLLLLDPGGVGERPLRLFRAAADEVGWVLACANGVRSDGSGAANARVLNAVLGDVTRRLPVDERRIYAGGFSGGAVLAWVMALRAAWLAGAICVGGRPAPEHADLAPKCAVFVAAGEEDFNRRPSVELDRIAARAGVPHRLVFFPGPHAWLSADLARDAVVWHELLAARDGKAALPGERLEAYRLEALASARAREEAGDVLGAARRYREAAATFPGQASSAALEGRAAELEESPAGRTARRQEKAAEAYEERSERRLLAATRLLREETPPPSGERLARALELDATLRQASGEGAEASAARRVLAAVRAQLAFGGAVAAELLRVGDWRRVRPAFAIAARAAPRDPLARYNLACAQARCGETEKALASLAEALDLGLPEPLRIGTDEDLASLRARPELGRLLERAKAVGPSPPR